MLFISTVIGKSLLFLSKLLGRGGSALPGLVIEKIYPRFLPRVLNQLPHGVIIVTGTNGKTTTTKIISELLGAYNLRVLTNKTGSNFVRGIIAAIVKHISLFGRLPYDIAVFEQDEAHAVHLVKRIQPRGVVALNVGRDQMDRFGEIDKTAKLIGKVVAQASDWVVLNANDPRISALAKEAPAARKVWFGHAEALLPFFLGDDQHHAGANLKYFSAAKADVLLKDMKKDELALQVQGVDYHLQTKLDGTHNALNIAAALATLIAEEPNVTLNGVVPAVAAIEPAFGRGERITLKDDRELRLQLIKNPASFTHALRLLDEHKFGAVGVVINDDYPDGRDVSWLWDVDFSPLQNPAAAIFCGGTRA